MNSNQPTLKFGAVQLAMRQQRPGVRTFFERGGGIRLVPIGIGPGIPTGFRPKAQGCEARATLGNRRPTAQPQRGCVSIPIESFGNLSQVRVQRYTLVPKKWTAVFGGEDEVNVNVRMRLGHGSPFILCRNPVGVVAFADHLPRVARASQPWALGRNPFGISLWKCPNSRALPRSLTSHSTGFHQKLVSHHDHQDFTDMEAFS